MVSAASYEARVFGVRSAMPLRTAGALCPHGVFLPVDGRKYAAVSRQVMAILRRFTPLVEPISIDEAFLDVAGTEALFGDATAVAVAIRRAIADELPLTASVGVAATKLVAKIASDLRKPDGLVIVPPGEEADFLAPLPDLAPVGRRPQDTPGARGATASGRSATWPRSILRRSSGASGAMAPT